MYQEIKEIGKFVREFVNPNYRINCYYEKFSDKWREVHKNTLEGMEVDARIHHRDESNDNCSLVNWVLSFGRV